MQSESNPDSVQNPFDHILKASRIVIKTFSSPSRQEATYSTQKLKIIEQFVKISLFECVQGIKEKVSRELQHSNIIQKRYRDQNKIFRHLMKKLNMYKSVIDSHNWLFYDKDLDKITEDINTVVFNINQSHKGSFAQEFLDDSKVFRFNF